MHAGRSRAARALIVSQAALVWAMIQETTTAEDLAEYIATGKAAGLEQTERAGVLPYNPAVLEQIGKTWTW